MGTITIADNKFYFDTPVVIEGETISYVENEDVNFILATDLALANRFFKEMVFRQKKFNRVRLDGIDAKKEDQLSDKFEDYKMSIFARPDLSAFPTEEQILKKEDCMVNGRPHSSLAIAFSIDQYADTKTKMDIDRRKRELSEMKEKIKLELTAGTPDMPTENPTVLSSMNQGNKQQEKAQIKTIIDGIDSAIARSKVNPFVNGEKDKEKVSTLEYVEPDFEKEPYKTNKFLGQFIEQIKDKSGGKLVACATTDTSNMLFWVYVYDAATKEQQHDKCVVLDLNGRIVNAMPKFWRMRDVLKYEDGPEMLKYYIPMTPDNIKTLVDGKPFSFSETGNEAIAMALNKMVNICTILDYNGATTEDKAGICATIQNYLEFIQTQFILEPTRFRLSAFDPVTKAFTLTQDSLCTRGLYGKLSGPAIPISLRFEQNQPPYLIPQQQPVQTQQGAA